MANLRKRGVGHVCIFCATISGIIFANYWLSNNYNNIKT